MKSYIETTNCGIMKPNIAMLVPVWAKDKLFHVPHIISKKKYENGRKNTKKTFIIYIYFIKIHRLYEHEYEYEYEYEY